MSIGAQMLCIQARSVRNFQRRCVSGRETCKTMEGDYHSHLVALSITVAVIASYTALDLANRVTESASSPRRAWVWLIAGAVSMGTGIRAMHFLLVSRFHRERAVQCTTSGQQAEHL